MIGKLVTSKAGHDKGCIYIVVKEEAEYVYAADGIGKTLANPKKKNKKHIQPINKGANEELAQKLAADEPVRDEEIKRTIKLYQLSNR